MSDVDKLRSIDIKFLKGVGPAKAKLLHDELSIDSYYDLLYHFPTSYVDRTSVYSIRSFSGEMPVIQVKGHFVSFNTVGEGVKMRLVGLFSDGTGTMEVVWFHKINALKAAYIPGQTYVLFGKPSEFSGRWSMVHPEVDAESSSQVSFGLRGVYPLTEKLRNRGFTSRIFSSLIRKILDTVPFISDPLPSGILKSRKLMGLDEALRTVHNPKSNDALQQARTRLKFEELFYVQLDILSYAVKRKMVFGGFKFARIGYCFNTFYSNCLPFPLTGAQKRVIKEIRADMGSGKQMNRLLQGDVGSGKTLVALLCSLIALDNNTQVCIMAPTEILAAQHFETISSLVAPIGINVKLLTGSTPGKQREAIHGQLEDGSLHILVGTHAVLEENVKFSQLGFVVIDEQHRFGVAQRARLWTKGRICPHVLVMTATPIPRTLAMTMYGDLDVSVIDELPPGRRPVVTLLKYEPQRLDVYRSLGKQLKMGRQAYIVYPLIKENEKSDLKSIEEGYEQIKEIFREYRVAYVHGRMKPAEKEYQMSLFSSGEARILVATTVIEVGVNVPNATTMIIENAERFGLSQLHQLRGRVGRGGDQSYCVLMSKVKLAKETRQRLEIMTSTTDGFVVAEADMKMRGPGDIEGTMQSGLPFDLKIASLTTDGDILQMARDSAKMLLDSDPSLLHSENGSIKKEMLFHFRRSVDWSRIS